jgi:Cu+-exporting ATPase
VYIAIDGTVRGYYRVANAMREGLAGLMESLRGHVRLSLLSGDKDSDRDRIVSLLGPEADIHFSQKPADKLAYINDKVVAGERVLMVGDGLNDAGALQAATVGVSVAEKESSFSPASDGILHSNGLIRLGEFIALSRSGLAIIKVSFALSFLYNIIGMYIAVQGTLSPVIAAILMPASSVSVVLFTTIMSTIRARRMGLV